MVKFHKARNDGMIRSGMPGGVPGLVLWQRTVCCVMRTGDTSVYRKRCRKNWGILQNESESDQFMRKVEREKEQTGNVEEIR